MRPGGVSSCRRPAGRTFAHGDDERHPDGESRGVRRSRRAARPGPPPHVRQLGQSPADSHLRQLCASCHLGQEKSALGPNGEDARGGGCMACHLSYGADTLAALRRYEGRKSQGRADAPRRIRPSRSTSPTPSVSAATAARAASRPATKAGTKCTSRQPRRNGVAVSNPPRFRTLADERVFERVVPDIHQERGLDCIDCHTATEVMGDGIAHGRKSEALRVACEDCHARPGRRCRPCRPRNSIRSRAKILPFVSGRD